MEQNREPRNKPTQPYQPIFDKDAKNIHWRNGAGKTRYLHIEE
jgi:environmental stress-induced protein Ves